MNVFKTLIGNITSISSNPSISVKGNSVSGISVQKEQSKPDEKKVMVVNLDKISIKQSITTFSNL